MEEEVEAEEGLVTAEDEEDSEEDSGEEEVEASSPQTEDFGAVVVAEEPQEAEGVEEGGVAEVVSEEGRRS